MPSQRKKGKKTIGGYVSGELKESLVTMARREDLNEIQLLEIFLREGMERYKKNRVPKKLLEPRSVGGRPKGGGGNDKSRVVARAHHEAAAKKKGKSQKPLP